MENSTFPHHTVSQPAHSTPQSELPLKKLTTPMIVGIAIGTIALTGVLLYGMNMLLSPRVKPSPSPSLEPIATQAPALTIDPRDIPTPEPTPTLTPKPSPTPTLTPKPSVTPTPTASASAAPATSVTITAIGGQDGYVDSIATVSASQDIRVGRNNAATIRGLFGFDIGSLPKTAKITSAVLRLYQSSVVGSPYTAGGSIVVDHLDFGGTITADDYNGGNVYASSIGTISTSTSTEWKTLDVTERIKYDLSVHTSAQFRLRFTTETVGGDATGDVAVFSSKNSGYDTNPPQLVITYN